MKRSIFFLFTFLTVSAVGCATMSVKTDYDRDQPIPTVKTFAWMEQPAKPVRSPIVQNSLMDKRIKRTVERELRAFGYEMNVESPALLIVYHTGLEDKIDVSSYGYGYGHGYRGHGYRGHGYCRHGYGHGYGHGYRRHGYGHGAHYGRGYGGGVPYVRSYKEGTLILDFVDPETMQLIWRGWAVGAFDDPENLNPTPVL